MPTPKFNAVQKNRHIHVLYTDNDVYVPLRSSAQVKVGDNVFMAKRIGNPHGEEPVWEVWPFVVQEDEYMRVNGYKQYPKVWYGKGRYLFEKQKG